MDRRGGNVTLFIAILSTAYTLGNEIREYCEDIFDERMKQTLYYVVFTMSLIRIYFTIVEVYVPYLAFLFNEGTTLFVFLFLYLVIPAISAWSVKQLLEDWSLFVFTAISLLCVFFFPFVPIQIILRCVTMYICYKRIDLFDKRYILLFGLFVMSL